MKKIQLRDIQEAIRALARAARVIDSGKRSGSDLSARKRIIWVATDELN